MFFSIGRCKAEFAGGAEGRTDRYGAEECLCERGISRVGDVTRKGINQRNEGDRKEGRKSQP